VGRFADLPRQATAFSHWPKRATQIRPILNHAGKITRKGM
jgi:hypothetical protein